MKVDSFGTWFSDKTSSKTNRIVTLSIAIASLATALLVIGGFFKDLMDFIPVDNKHLLYINLTLHFVLIVLILMWPKPSAIHYDEKAIADLNKLRTISFFSIAKTELKQKFERSNQNVVIYFKTWKKIWLAWLGLYVFILLGASLEESGTEDIKNYSKLFIGFFGNTLNNLATLMLLWCFIILSEEGKLKENAHLEYEHFDRGIYILIILTIAELVTRLLFAPGVHPNMTIALYFKEPGPHGNLNLLFSAISGLLACVVTAQLVGRLDSKLIGPPIWVITLLYGYAGLQLFFRDFNGPERERVMIAVMYAALFFKCVFLLFTFWLIETKRLFFYFFGVNQIHSHIKEQWINISKILITEPETSTPTFDVSGRWSMIEKYDHGMTRGELLLQQVGTIIEGKIEIIDLMEAGYRFKIEEILDGQIEHSTITLVGKSWKILEGQTERVYNLDKWIGEFEGPNRIVGKTIDTGNIQGEFTFTRNLDKL